MAEKIDRVPTFIPGFDKLIGGGFVRNSVNLISGGPGSGKSIFCLHHLFNGIAQAGEKALYISFEEGLDDLKVDAKSIGLDFDAYEKSNHIKFIYLYPYEITNFQSRLIGEITRINAQRVVIDSTSAFGMALEGDYEVRKELYALSAQLKKLNCTTIITSEITSTNVVKEPLHGKMSRFGVEEFIADAVVILYVLGMGMTDDWAVRIAKMRRTDHQKGLMPMKIDGKGISIGAKPISKLG